MPRKKKTAAVTETVAIAAVKPGPKPGAPLPVVREFGALCPACRSSNARVVITRERIIGGQRRIDRWRECACGQKFRSWDLVQESYHAVVTR
jgi:hypothetical protein